MENISYIGLSHQMALTSMMNVTANNIANMSTPGYKDQRVLFTDYLNKGEKAQPKDAIHQVQDYSTYRDVLQGSLQHTGNDLDVALEGNGYLSVTTPDGTAYTRNGSFSLNGNGELVTQQGYLVQGEGGGPLVIPPESHHVTITPDGQVSTEDGEIGQLKLTDFKNPQHMQARGDGLYTADAQAQPQAADKVKVVQGSIEASNVNPILEMNRMVEVLRAYQSTYRMLTNDHERIRGAIQKLTKV